MQFATAVRDVGLRLVGLAALAVLAAAVHGPDRGLPCLLRALTGAPCPFCGSTTAAVAVGELRPLAALAASPLAILGAGALAFSPVLSARIRQIVVRRRLLITMVGLAASEVWQLIRLG